MINRAMTLEKATQICEEAGIELVNYSGRAQREKSRLRCKICHREWDMIVGDVRAGKRCTCRQKQNMPQSSTVTPFADVLEKLENIESKINQLLRSVAVSAKTTTEPIFQADGKDLSSIKKKINAPYPDEQEQLRRLEVNEKYITEHMPNFTVIQSKTRPASGNAPAKPMHSVRCKQCGVEWTASVVGLERDGCPSCHAGKRSIEEWKQ